MLTVESLKKAHGAMRADLNAVQARAARLADETAKIEADQSRTPVFRQRQLAELRQLAADELAPVVARLDQAAKSVGAQSRFWSNRTLVMSRQRFHPDDDALDHMARLRHCMELQGVGADALAATIDDTMDDLTRAAGVTRSPLVAKLAAALNATGAAANLRPDGTRIKVDVASVALPEMEAAAQLIRECASMNTIARAAYETASSGRKPEGAQSLAVARAQQSLLKPTGRPAPAAA